jgi:hypothetical protein
MTGDSQRKTLITRYLLGQASVEERAELEDQYLHDDDLFEEIVAAENDLIDAYVRGDFDAHEQSQFEATFLSIPERRERVEFARSLMRAGSTRKMPVAGARKSGSGWFVSKRSEPGPAPLWQLGLAAALLVAVAGLAWVTVSNRELHHQLDAARAAQADALRQVQALRQQIADLQEGAAGQDPTIVDLPRPGSTILSLTLAPDLVRSGAQQQSTLRPAAGISEVRLLLRRNHETYSNYAAVLETAEAKQVWRKSNLAAQVTRDGGKVIIVRVPPSILGPEDYVLRLSSTQSGGQASEIGTYSFRVVK